MKHGKKTALAVAAVLAGVGNANATTYNYTVGIEGLITGISTGFVSSTDSTPGTDDGPAAPGSFPTGWTSSGSAVHLK